MQIFYGYYMWNGWIPDTFMSILLIPLGSGRSFAYINLLAFMKNFFGSQFLQNDCCTSIGLASIDKH